jgi:hypothetical protein
MSVLIKVTHKKVADFPYLFRLVLRYIYEPHRMRADEIHLMQDSMIGWSKKAHLNEDQTYILERLAFMLKKKESGEYEGRIKLFKEKGVDWRKYHRLPEAYDIKELMKTRSNLGQPS